MYLVYYIQIHLSNFIPSLVQTNCQVMLTGQIVDKFDLKHELMAVVEPSDALPWLIQTEEQLHLDDRHRAWISVLNLTNGRILQLQKASNWPKNK